MTLRKAAAARDDVLGRSTDALKQLSGLVEELNTHTKNMQREVQVLSFMTMVDATENEGNRAAFETLGGVAGVRRVVMHLYELILRDPRIAHYFQGADMMHVRHRQVQMLLALLGVSDYEGPALSNAHYPHRITAADFDVLISHVETALRGGGVSGEPLEAILANLRGFRNDVVFQERRKA